MRHFLLLSSLLAVVLPPIAAVAQPSEGSEEEVSSEDDVVSSDDEEVVAADEDEVVAGDEDEVVAGDDDAVVAEPAEPEEVVQDAPPEVSPVAAGLPAEGTFEPGEEPYRAPKPGMSVIWGRVVDSKSGEPALEASVKALGTKYETFTDFDGYYRLEVPPGTYRLEIFYELYDTQTVSGVTAPLNAVERTDVQMAPQSGAIDEVLIEEAAERATLEGQILSRQRSASAQDGIGRAEISKTPDSNAAEAAQRVVGATVVGGRFVYVRGLGERYTNALLHGAPLPSPDPNRASVPLDLFPTLVIDSININKTFTPDMPADFAGGSVSIETRDIPYKPVFSIALKGAYNDQATFRNRPGYAGGGLDFLGVDDGTRALPAGWPADSPVYRNAPKPDGSRMSDEELTQLGQSLAQHSLVSSGTETPLNHGLSIVGGNGWKFGKESRFGFIASANYDRSYERITDGTERVLNLDQGEARQRYDWKFNAGQDTVRWGLFGAAILEINKNNSLRLMGMSMRNTNNRAQIFDGRDYGTDTTINNTRLSFVQQQMNLGQLRGEHLFPELAHAELSYNAFLARATRDEPDTRDSVYYYSSSEGPPYTIGEGSDSGRHFYSGQFEDTYGGLMNWTQPLKSDLHKLKFGGLVMRKDRDFAARRFYYYRNPRIRLNCPDEGSTFPADCPDEHFTDANVGTGSGDSALRVQEGTRTTDAFESELGVYAGYAQIDTEPLDRLRLVAGARVEVTDQTARPVGQLGLTPDVEAAQLNDVDLLPAASLIFAATKNFKLRLGYGRTLARPQVRELAPFAFNDYYGGMETLGNPNLQLTKIHNFDARIEFFPTLREVLAFSVFAKTFSNPIEPILRPAGDGTNITYVNTPGANLIGVEAEARKNLGFITPALNPFSVVTNISLIASKVDIDQGGADTGASQSFMTNSNRAMVNQAPVVFNFALDYQNEAGTSARILFNVSGARIVQVGTVGLPDAYEQPRPMLDASFGQKFWTHWEAKFTLENLLNSPVKVTQGEGADGPNVIREYTTGRIAGLTLKYEFQ